MFKKVFIKNNRGQKLAAVVHYPKKGRKNWPAIVLVHGSTGNKDLNFFPELAKVLARQGFLAVRFDLAGSGESDGKFGEQTYSSGIGDIKAVVDHLWEKGLRRIGLLGHSVGGAKIILEAARDPRVSSLVCLASEGDPRKNPRSFLRRRFKIIFRDRTGVVFQHRRLKSIFKINSSFFKDRRIHSVIKSIVEVKRPILFIVAEFDQLIPFKDIKRLYEKSRREMPEIKEMKIIKGADHIFSKSKPRRKMIKLTVDWFKKYLGQRHIKATIAFIKSKDKILVLKRSNKVSYYPGYWHVVGGHLDKASEVRKNVFKEIEEEVGFKRNQVKFIKSSKPYQLYDREKDIYWRFYPALVEVKTRKVKLDWEHTAYRWIKPADFLKLKILPKMIEAYQELFK